MARRHLSGLTPWYWGINGAMSVLASVLAVAISLNWGISVSFWTGLAGYAAAFIAAAVVAYRSRASKGLVKNSTE